MNPTATGKVSIPEMAAKWSVLETSWSMQTTVKFWTRSKQIFLVASDCVVKVLVWQGIGLRFAS
jgi:hypothetical protein